MGHFSSRFPSCFDPVRAAIARPASSTDRSGWPPSIARRAIAASLDQAQAFFFDGEGMNRKTGLSGSGLSCSTTGLMMSS
jgi:hypothetical protein